MSEAKTIYCRVPLLLDHEQIYPRLGVALVQLAFGKAIPFVSPDKHDRKKVRIELDAEMFKHLQNIRANHSLTQNDAVNAALFEIYNNRSIYGVVLNEETI